MFFLRAPTVVWLHPAPANFLTQNNWGTLNLREWTLREWTIRHDVAGVDIAGVDNAAPCDKGGQCGSGQCRSGELRVKMCNIVMTAKESMAYYSLTRLTVDNMQGRLCC